MSSNIAIVFPGQGSQSIGMLDTVSKNFAEVAELLKEASDAVGYDIGNLISKGPAEQLNQTEYTQVAMLVADVVYYRLLMMHAPLVPMVMAGHSLGEYAALVCSNALGFSDAAQLVAMRGRIMQETVPQGKGSMAAVVGLEDAMVEQICRENSNAKEQVVPANFNSTGQIVIAGHSNAVSAAVAQAENAGAKLACVIPVSVPCHCSLLQPAAEQFSKILADTSFKAPQCPVLSNIDALAYTNESDIRERLAKQLFSPVQWVATVNVFKDIGIDTVIECGPGKTLSGLVKRIDRQIALKSVADILDAKIETTP